MNCPKITEKYGITCNKNDVNVDKSSNFCFFSIKKSRQCHQHFQLKNLSRCW